MMVRFACLAVAALVALPFSTRAAELDPALVRIQKDLFYLAGDECNGASEFHMFLALVLVDQ